ncbi:MAG: metallophosphoesterase family protein [bacterium]
MKLALISDIHGNLEAFTAVLEDIEKKSADRIHCLGDVVGYGSEPGACLQLVADTCEFKLMGNHEHVILGLDQPDNYTHIARISAAWTRKQLSDRALSIIAEFRIDHHDDEFYLVHASPDQPDRWHYVLTPEEAAGAFVKLNERLCFYGHSHVPMIFTESPGTMPRRRVGHTFLPDPDSRYLINVGSVGQPRDNDPRACYVIYDTDEDDVTYCRVDYDIESAQSKMAQAQLPDMLIDRLAVGR